MKQVTYLEEPPIATQVKVVVLCETFAFAKAAISACVEP
jgi:hypothetical protein